MPDFKDVIRHHTLSAGEYAIAADNQGRVDTLYREFQITVAQMVREFGKDKCSTTVQNLFDRGALEQWVTVIHAIEPRADRDPNKRDDRNMAWKSVYVESVPTKPAPCANPVIGRSHYARAGRWPAATSTATVPRWKPWATCASTASSSCARRRGIDYKSNPPLQLPVSTKNQDISTMPGGLSYGRWPHPTVVSVLRSRSTSTCRTYSTLWMCASG